MITRRTRHTSLVLAGLLMTFGLACSSGTDSTDEPSGTSGRDSGVDRTSADAGSTPPPSNGTVDASPEAAPPVTPSDDAGASPDTGADLPLDQSWTFDTTVSPWDVDYAEPESLKGVNGTLLEHDPVAGVPAAGSLKATIPFTAASQKVDIALNLEQPMDLTGKRITARFKLDSGLTPNAQSPGGAKLYVKSGAGFIYADSGWNNLNEADGWIELTLKADKPGGYVATTDAGAYTATDIRQIGIEIGTGSTGTGWTTAVIHIDTVGWR